MFFFGIALYLSLRDLVFAIGLPLGLYVFGFLASRAFGASWVVRLDEEEAIFRKPAALRTLFGAMALGMAGVLTLWVHLWISSSRKEDVGIEIFGLVLFTLITLLFLWSTGPMDTRFDLRRGHVLYRVGPPFLAKPVGQDKSEVAALRVIVTRRRGSVMHIRWKGRRRHSGTTARFETGEEARIMAEHIGSRLGLPVELRPV